ncbi:MAG: hypothetical protein L0206_24260, partial [Actinobacteria bacterium]|nr:hypothetical protein [Actinomycetota bacterium]
NTRSDLDQPIDLYLNLPVRTRGGFVHQQLSVQLLRAARPQLGESEFARISALPQLDPDFQPARNNSIARGFLAEMTRAEAAGNMARVAELQIQLDDFSRGLTGVPFAETRNAEVGEILDFRSDPDRFAPLDRANNAQIGRNLWGASQYTDAIVPWLTNMGFEVRPWGYFTAGPIDSVNQSAIGLAESFSTGDRVLGTPSPEVGADQLPFYFGPDGLRHTPDDLPNVACPDPVTGLETAPGPDGRCVDPTDTDPSDDASDPDLEPLYYVVPDPNLTGDPNDPAQFEQARAACEAATPVNSVNGAAGGFNSRGQCIILSVYGNVVGGSAQTGSNDATLAALSKLLDPRFRPATASVDPS